MDLYLGWERWERLDGSALVKCTLRSICWQLLAQLWNYRRVLLLMSADAMSNNVLLWMQILFLKGRRPPQPWRGGYHFCELTVLLFPSMSYAIPS